MIYPAACGRAVDYLRPLMERGYQEIKIMTKMDVGLVAQ
jgi:hypothetical protein